MPIPTRSTPAQPSPLDRAESLLASMEQELVGATHDQVSDTVLTMARAVEGYRTQTARTAGALRALGEAVSELRAAAQSRPPGLRAVESEPDAETSAG